MIDFLQTLIEYHIEEAASMILFGIGFSLLLLNRNLIKKIMGLNIMDTAVYLFLTAKGYVYGRMVPIMNSGITDPNAYTNPIPDGLVLTGIVVSVSVSAILLSLTIRLYDRYHTLDLDKIITEWRKEEDN
ncbi:MAG: cation:proton antiporter subunit C [Lachnospiraceae bacterium]|nr:cation:proton antiporter subunit C [Lachnospiraceae bacterium]